MTYDTYQLLKEEKGHGGGGEPTKLLSYQMQTIGKGYTVSSIDQWKLESEEMFIGYKCCRGMDLTYKTYIYL